MSKPAPITKKIHQNSFHSIKKEELTMRSLIHQPLVLFLNSKQLILLNPAYNVNSNSKKVPDHHQQKKRKRGLIRHPQEEAGLLQTVNKPIVIRDDWISLINEVALFRICVAVRKASAFFAEVIIYN